MSHVPAHLDRMRYPIGRYVPPVDFGSAQRSAWIADIQSLPTELRAAVSELDNVAFDRPYRPGGWTIRQVVHHLADSHLNSYIRFRLALTEPNPEIKTYAEELWAELPDARTGPIDLSLVILDGLHARWTLLLNSLREQDFSRTFRHPQLGNVTIAGALGLYAWHGRHHLAHIAQGSVEES